MATSNFPSIKTSMRFKKMTQISTPDTSVGKILNDLPGIDPRVHKGIKVTKITNKGVLKNRILTISEDNFLIFITKASVSKGGFGDIVTAMKKNTPSWPGITDKTDLVRFFDISDILHVQVGFMSTKKFELGYSKNKTSRAGKIFNDESSFVSIIYREQKSLDLFIPNKQDREMFINSLSQIRQAYHGNKYREGMEQMLLRYTWYDVDSDRNGHISHSELRNILNRLNYHMSKDDVKKQYGMYLQEEGSKNETPPEGGLKYGLPKFAWDRGITFNQCIKFLQTLKKDNTSDMIWDQVFGNSADTVSAEDFLERFLKETQRERDAQVSDVQALFKFLNDMSIAYAKDPPDDPENYIDRDRFEAFLNSPKNEAWDPNKTRFVESSMDKPLTHYWINTSHNTYLTGDQLNSKSSVQMYMMAMQRGCKCLELDCWDGDKNDDGEPVPVVYHGHTLTSKITFASIIRCVRGFVDSHPGSFPIILSLENHCSFPYQLVMAKILQETLGDLLFVPDPETLVEQLPSPASLKGMVVIKGKRPPEPDDQESDDEDEDDEDDKSEDEGKNDGKKKAHKPKVVPELAKLTLFNGTKYKSFDTSIGIPASHMHSINESKITKILDKSKENCPKWRQYNVQHMTRTYPAGSRVNSSNYNPILAWSMGCQMVALNFQTNDSKMIMNDGRFKENGQCGYVLKPPSIMEGGSDESFFHGSMTLRIRVVSGCCMPKPSGDTKGETIDPYVKVTVHDVLADKNENSDEDFPWTSSESHETKYINDNGFCPVWNEKEFKEFKVEAPDVAMVVFSVMDSDTGFDDRLAAASVPVNCLRRGFRSLTLSDYYGNDWGPFDFVSLLVEIDF